MDTLEEPGLSRRTVVKAAAWSVPIMAVGSNAPAMAMSPVLQFDGLACKWSGNSCQNYPKSYLFGFKASSLGLGQVCISITSVKMSTDPAGANLVTPPNFTSFVNATGGVTINGCNCQLPGAIATILVDGEGTFDIVGGEFGDSNNSRIVVEYTALRYNNGSCGLPAGQGPADSGVRSTPPCSQIPIPCPT